MARITITKREDGTVDVLVRKTRRGEGLHELERGVAPGKVGDRLPAMVTKVKAPKATELPPF